MACGWPSSQGKVATKRCRRRSFLAQRVEIADETLQALFEHMGIDLGGRDVGVTEQGLDDAQIGAVVEEMAGEGMPQDMRAHLLGPEPDGAGQGLELAGEMLA